MAETVKRASKAASPAKPRKTASKKNAVAETQLPENNHHAENNHHHHSLAHDQVAQLAHRFWIERCRPHGSHEEDWFRAEQTLRSQAS